MSAYKRTRDGVTAPTYTIKFRFAGRQHTLQTGCTLKTDAEAIQRQVLVELRAGRIPKLLAQLQQRHSQTVGQLLEAYVAARCPDRRKLPRAAFALDAETRNCDTLRLWWSNRRAPDLCDADQDDYHTWRLQHVTRGTGHRASELELVTLRNALNWAVRARLLDRNPLTQAFHFRDTRTIAHARDAMPDSGDELHRLAARLLANPDTETYAWQTLLAALTGLRHSELRQLEANPQRTGTHYSPGYFDQKWLTVARAKKGRNPQVQLDDPQRPHILPLLNTIRAWHAARYPSSPWFLCQPDGAQLPRDCRLTKHLAATAAALGLPARRAHALRAYYASVRLAQGTPFDRVASELGQRSGDDLVRDVYGVEPADWKGLPNTYTWLPTSADVRPAWDLWSAPAQLLPMATVLATALATTFDRHQTAPNDTKTEPVSVEDPAQTPCAAIPSV
jgi:integrase